MSRFAVRMSQNDIVGKILFNGNSYNKTDDPKTGSGLSSGGLSHRGRHDGKPGAALRDAQGKRIQGPPSYGGVPALQGAKTSPPDLILLDINVPDMRGYDVCQRLKADSALKGIPVIFISALGDAIDKVQAF